MSPEKAHVCMKGMEREKWIDLTKLLPGLDCVYRALYSTFPIGYAFGVIPEAQYNSEPQASFWEYIWTDVIQPLYCFQLLLCVIFHRSLYSAVFIYGVAAEIINFNIKLRGSSEV